MEAYATICSAVGSRTLNVRPKNHALQGVVGFTGFNGGGRGHDICSIERSFECSSGTAAPAPDLKESGPSASDSSTVLSTARQRCLERRCRKRIQQGPTGFSTNASSPQRDAGGGLDVVESTLFSFRCRSPGGGGMRLPFSRAALLSIEHPSHAGGKEKMGGAKNQPSSWLNP